jgi:hypothetical protein
MRQDKFLVEFISHLTKKDVFIGAWLFGAAFFSYLMWSYSKKNARRNFRESDIGVKKNKVVSAQSEKSKVE